MARNAIQFLTETYRKPYRAAAPKPADECEELLWELARKFTNTRAEAAAAVAEMKKDLKQCDEGEICPVAKRELLIDRIAWLRLKRFLQ